MTEFIDTILVGIEYWVIISFFLGLIGIILLAYNPSKNHTDRIKNYNLKIKVAGIILIIQLVISAFLVFRLSAFVVDNAGIEVKEFLSQENLTIRIGNNKLDAYDSDKVILELRRMCHLPAHHSHPTDNEIKIQIVSGDKTMILKLYKDSKIPEEYWIFWDNYRTTTKSEIGRIRTTIFKSIEN